ncbi:MAG: 1-deoxy-D-xylulose-5-phosphate synthase [Pseudomonadales bacterium]|nr:1-deoxy-D-xylulose-5-phosphate synthase [Pseudomonadales bacterium]
MSSPRLFESIPTTAPATPLLDLVRSPADLRKLDEAKLLQLANELREELLYCVGRTGGHFGAGLGVVELSIALHYLLDTPDDALVWDVGHQSYPHKILTGRRERMHSMRQADGLAGFPKRDESEFDAFGAGHSSTSISAALGMALAFRAKQLNRQAVAVIGDGAMTAGMAFEALNHAADTGANLLVVLNDNQMSISKNIGGLATYFAKIWASKTYNQLREQGKKVLSIIPPASELAKRTEEHMKGMVAPGALFEELGFNYIGPIDGNDMESLLPTLRNVLALNGPRLLHISTIKGKGFAPAELDPVGYHAINKIEPQRNKANANANAPIAARSKAQPAASKKQGVKYQQVFGDWLCDLASVDDRLVGITPAMCEGSGMVEFSQRFADRYHDVAIAEQHAVTLAGGLACAGMKPVVAIYSTFLQRGYDQLIHDVALQNLDVTFGLDRAGLVGEDGPSHAGSFDFSFLRCVPNLIVAAPSDENETRQLLYTAYEFAGPAAVRYPRGNGPGAEIQDKLQALPIGKGVQRRQGSRAAILNFGALLPAAMTAAEKLGLSVVDMRFVKPLDTSLIEQLSANHELLVSVEDNALMGGAGSAVGEYLHAANNFTPLLQLALPDRFIGHGTRAQLLAECGLDAAGIERQVREKLEQINPAPGTRQQANTTKTSRAISAGSLLATSNEPATSNESADRKASAKRDQRSIGNA